MALFENWVKQIHARELPGGGCVFMAGALLMAGQLDRFIHFDHATGVLRCEAGVLLSTILQLVVPQLELLIDRLKTATGRRNSDEAFP